MDPHANLSEQREVAQAIVKGDDYAERCDLDRDAERLAELVLALDEWRAKGGFDPYRVAQAGALTELSDALREYDRAVIQDTEDAHHAAMDVANRAAELLTQLPRLAQAIALHERVTRAQFATVNPQPFDLPAGYLLVVEDPNQHPFTCGIGPDGSVSS